MGRVIGIVRDFHFQSLHKKIDPLVMTTNLDSNPIVTVKLSGENLNESIEQIKANYKETNYPYPFEYSFLDERITEMYLIDQKVGELVWYFTILSIVIACLGLFGLASYSIEKRTKEIGTRKVFGCSSFRIFRLLVSEFSLVILVSNIIAIPIAYFVINIWLENFEYKIDLSWWMFAIGIVATQLIALFAVSYQSFKAARKNPVEALRYE